MAESFSEEQKPFESDDANDNQAPEYVFEGYDVEFSEKIVLTAPQG